MGIIALQLMAQLIKQKKIKDRKKYSFTVWPFALKVRKTKQKTKVVNKHT